MGPYRHLIRGRRAEFQKRQLEHRIITGECVRMTKKSIKYALITGVIVIVGLMIYGSVYSSNDAQDVEKAYELRAAEITATQFRINGLTRQIFDSNLETSQCYVIKKAYGDTKANYDQLASLAAPLVFQYKHEALLAYLNNTYLMWLVQYNYCESSLESDKKYYMEEAATYGIRASELLTGEIIPWWNEWGMKYPKETGALYKKYHP